MKIVLVYSGSRLPKHHVANLNLLNQTFPDKTILTVVDNEENHRKLLGRGFQSYLIADEIPRFVKVSEQLSHDATFLRGFWYRTIKRFYLLHAFLKSNPNESIIHIESDVVLMPNFPFETFSDLDARLAYPLVTNDHAAASIFFVKSLSALDDFLHFVEEGLLEGSETDMTLLAKFARKSTGVCLLPSLVSSSPTIQSSKSNFLDTFGFDGVFDGATYGQYLFGLDPRNNFGIRKVFSRPEAHLVDPITLKFEIIKSIMGSTLLLTDVSGHTRTLYNIHVHSKDLRIFNEDLQAPRFLERRCFQSQKRTKKNEFDLSAFFFHFPSHFKGILVLIFHSIQNFSIKQK